jgi:hypothetical protein
MALTSFDCYVDLIDLIKSLDMEFFKYAVQTMKKKLSTEVTLYSKSQMLKLYPSF